MEEAFPGKTAIQANLKGHIKTLIHFATHASEPTLIRQHAPVVLTDETHLTSVAFKIN